MKEEFISLKSRDNEAESHTTVSSHSFYTPEEIRRLAQMPLGFPAPTPRMWLKHIAFFLVTLVTSTIAGTLPPFGNGVLISDEMFSMPASYEYFFPIAFVYGKVMTAVLMNFFQNPALIWQGLQFSVPLLTILTAHEFGHYIAARLYKVDVTLPYFVPSPPLIGPGGTFGAFIKLRSPMPSMKATFDVGVAGPIAGFVALLPFAFYAVSVMQPAPADFMPEIVFSEPLLLRLIGFLVGVDPSKSQMNPTFAAVWIGLLVTALNLIPVGQLDGGHAIYSVFGERTHKFVGRAAFLTMILLTASGFYLYGSPSGLLFVIFLGALLWFGHPPPLVEEKLGAKRLFIAFLTLLIFILSFSPFPIQINVVW